jgi:hypothetical protein
MAADKSGAPGDENGFHAVPCVNALLSLNPIRPRTVRVSRLLTRPVLDYRGVTIAGFRNEQRRTQHFGENLSLDAFDGWAPKP